MKNRILIPLLILLVSFVSCSKDDDTPSSTSFQQLSTRLQTALDNARTASDVNGVSVAVWVEGQTLWTGASGNSHGNVAITTDMRFGIGSITKSFTAALCLKLQEENMLNLDDPISTWLPSITNVNPNITLRQMLRHQSGIADYIQDDSFVQTVTNDPNKVWTTTELLAMVGEPEFQPGERIEYSNTNFILAGMILEVVSNKTYKDLVKEKILRPLNMENTYVEGFETVGGILAHPHIEGNDIFSIPRTSIGSVAWSAGCLVSIPEDLTKWWQAYYGNFLTEASRSQATDFQTQDGEDVRYGLGLLEFTIDGKKFIGHGGSTIGYEALSFYSEDKKQVITVFVNNSQRDLTPIIQDLIQVLN